jgi:hypothetical protein
MFPLFIAVDTGYLFELAQSFAEFSVGYEWRDCLLGTSIFSNFQVDFGGYGEGRC